MLTALAFGLVCQHLELAREVIEPGDPVEVRAVDAVAEPLVGLRIEIVEPDGSVRAVGITDPGGVVQLVTSEIGTHELRGRLPDGPVLITPFRVASRPRRWLYALVCAPLGLVLLFRNGRLLRRRARGRREPDQPDVTPGPCPPAP